MAINFAKQMFGTSTGQKIENAEDNFLKPLPQATEDLVKAFGEQQIKSFLASQGEPDTLAGAVDLVDKKLTQALDASGLPDEEKQAMVVFLNSLAAWVNTNMEPKAIS